MAKKSYNEVDLFLFFFAPSVVARSSCLKAEKLSTEINQKKHFQVQHSLFAYEKSTLNIVEEKKVLTIDEETKEMVEVQKEEPKKELNEEELWDL